MTKIVEKNKKQVGGLSQSDLKIYYQAIGDRTVWAVRVVCPASVDMQVKGTE